jgi:hypothetical protein
MQPTQPKQPPPRRTDREIFMQSLALFDRPESKDRVFESDVDIDAFVERALGNATIPPT